MQPNENDFGKYCNMRQDVGLFGIVGFLLVSPLERAMIYRDVDPITDVTSTIDVEDAIPNIYRQKDYALAMLSKPGRIKAIWERLFSQTETDHIIPRVRANLDEELSIAAESYAAAQADASAAATTGASSSIGNHPEFSVFDLMLSCVRALIDAYSIFSTLSVAAVLLDDAAWDTLTADLADIYAEEVGEECVRGVGYHIWELVSAVKTKMYQNMGVTNWAYLSVLRALRRGLDDVVADYSQALNNHHWDADGGTLGKALVMQVKIEHSLFQHFGQAVWDTYDGNQHRQFRMVANVTARIRFVQTDELLDGDPNINKLVAVMCEPHTVVFGKNSAWGVPIPRYALIQLEFAKFSTQGTVTVRSGLVGDDGSRVGPSSCGVEYEYNINMDLYNDEENDEVSERQVLVAGPQVPQGLLEHHIVHEILPNPALVTEAIKSIRLIRKLDKYSPAVRTAAERYHLILTRTSPDKVAAAVQRRRATDQAGADAVVKHADMDDSVRKLRVKKRLDWGVTLEAPRGTEWRERVPLEWEGDVEGSLLRVALDPVTGLITKRSKRRFIPIKSETLSAQAAFTLGPFTLGLTGSDIRLRRRNTIEPTQLLRSAAPAPLARLALRAVELQQLHFGRNSASYLPPAPDGATTTPRHIASIPSDALSGNDAYFRRRDQALFLLTNQRSLRLLPGRGSCKYAVRDEEFNKHDCVLAFLRLDPGTVG